MIVQNNCITLTILYFQFHHAITYFYGERNVFIDGRHTGSGNVFIKIIGAKNHNGHGKFKTLTEKINKIFHNLLAKE